MVHSPHHMLWHNPNIEYQIHTREFLVAKMFWVDETLHELYNAIGCISYYVNIIHFWNQIDTHAPFIKMQLLWCDEKIYSCNECDFFGNITNIHLMAQKYMTNHYLLTWCISGYGKRTLNFETMPDLRRRKL